MANKQKKYWFYNKDKLNLIEIDDKFKYFFFKPTLFNLKLHKGSVKLYLFWYIFSLGRYRIFYILEKESNNIAHYSNILPKIFKYDFMKNDDWYIANCYTDAEYRGCRLYPFALYFIGKSFDHYIVVWGGVREDNIASIKGLVRAGYKKVSDGYKSKFFGIYRVNE
ncbi:MAG: hypothetical protein VX347_03980 [Bacteroidota bacterium]|nr:hypothetical protein [Bacteroidota bacterium]